MPKKEEKIVDAKIEKEETDKNEASSGLVMGILSYLGILALIPFFCEKNNKFVVFHAKWGMKLLLTDVFYGIAASIISSVIKVRTVVWGVEYYTTPGWLSTILSLGYIVITVLSIIGIVTVCKKEKKPLPLIEKITFLDQIIK